MTFTVLARDPRLHFIGAATASRSLAVGNSVIAVQPGVGAVASQAWTNRGLRARLLAELRAGRSAADAVSRVPEWDVEHAWRQVAALGITGQPAARSGDLITPWAGAITGPDEVFAGNLLTGPEVLQAMADAPANEDAEASIFSFARSLVRTLLAGEAAGGDARGRQSAALLVADASDVLIDLRVDDDPDPLRELLRLVALRAG